MSLVFSLVLDILRHEDGDQETRGSRRPRHHEHSRVAQQVEENINLTGRWEEVVGGRTELPTWDTMMMMEKYARVAEKIRPRLGA